MTIWIVLGLVIIVISLLMVGTTRIGGRKRDARSDYGDGGFYGYSDDNGSCDSGSDGGGGGDCGGGGGD